MTWFKFVVKIMVTYSVAAMQCLDRATNISASHTALPAMNWGCTGSWEETQPGQLTQTV